MNSLFQDGATISWLMGESLILNHARRSVVPERLSDALPISSLSTNEVSMKQRNNTMALSNNFSVIVQALVLIFRDLTGYSERNKSCSNNQCTAYENYEVKLVLKDKNTDSDISAEERKILMVISDGAPVDDSTLSVNSGDFLEKHLKKTVKFIEEKTETEILAIGIGHDVSRYYNRAIKITDVNELGDVMISQLSTLFDKKSKLH